MKPVHILAFVTMLTLVVVGASPSQAQEQGQFDRAALDTVASAFDTLAENFAELGYKYRPMQEEYLQRTRGDVCAIFSTDGQIGVELIANDGQQFLRNLTNEQKRDLWDQARSGDRFTEFLYEEDDVLANNEILGPEARELILQLAIDFRRSVAWPDSDDLGILSGQEAAFGVTLLCDEQHSPGRNESEASWWTWFRGAVKFVGGIVTAGADAVFAPSAIKPLSVRIGLGAARSGYYDLACLIGRENDTSSC